MDNLLRKILPSQIAQSEHLAEIVGATIAVLGRFDLKPILIYLIDTANEETLLKLAGQFNVLGLRGWAFTDTLESKRNLIKKAIELQKVKGTPWSIKNAILAAGFGGVEFEEDISEDVFYDGEYFYSGAVFYTGLTAGWAIFNIKLDLGPNYGFDAVPLAINIINEYKPARSIIGRVSIVQNFTERTTINEDLE